MHSCSIIVQCRGSNVCCGGSQPEGKWQLRHITSWVPDFPSCLLPHSSSVKWENGAYWNLLKAQRMPIVGAGDPTPLLGVVIVLHPHLLSYTLTLLASRTPLSLGAPPKSPAMARALSSDHCAPSQGDHLQSQSLKLLRPTQLPNFHL